MIPVAEIDSVHPLAATDLSSSVCAEGSYTTQDLARYVPESHSGSRTDFQRDRARLIHSSGFRRLALKTQVLSPTSGTDFARNRLTHSLEVAQIGRELAVSLGANPDLVDTACLAHDLGHPPFGHNGEQAVNAWADGIGGFEGNAQTLRLLVRLEAKRFGAGLNLTRATLDASCKYPWARGAAPDGGGKFGFYGDDEPVFRWLRLGAPVLRKCFEAQLMDLADDIAYSVHDFEDAIFGGHIDPAFLASPAGHADVLRAVSQWGGEFGVEELGGAYERLSVLPNWPVRWSAERGEQARLKNCTSDLIGRFARPAIACTRESCGGLPVSRYGGSVRVPREVLVEIAFLKGVVGAFVMRSGKRQPVYEGQRKLLLELLDVLWLGGGAGLSPEFLADFRVAADERAARRVVVDQVACLGDQGAVALHGELCGGGSSVMFL